MRTRMTRIHRPGTWLAPRGMMDGWRRWGKDSEEHRPWTVVGEEQEG